MAGRADYEERKQDRIDRLNYAAGKASVQASAQYKRSHDLVEGIPLGQPNIAGRPALPNLRAKSIGAFERGVEASDKAGYYAGRAEAAESNTAISSDDPNAIVKLREKLAGLEAQRETTKASNKERKKAGKEQNPSWMLSNLGATIRNTKERIAQLEELENMPAEIIRFEGGEIISDADSNRVQIIFDERQDEAMTDKLKRYGFHWAPSEGAWQRLRNPNALYAAKRACKVYDEEEKS